jgi:hypothetical protein
MTLEMKRELVRQLLSSDGWRAVCEHLDTLQEKEARGLIQKRVVGAEVALVRLTEAQKAIECYKKVQSLCLDDVVPTGAEG